MFRRVYLDNAATTPVDPRVVEALLPFVTEQYGNPSSIHFFGQQARAAVDRARHNVADLIGARPNEIVFTSGGTESNNLAIKGLLEANSRHGSHLVTSAIEHPAVGSICEHLERKGFEVSTVSPSQTGVIDADEVMESVRSDTILVSVMAANNEIGTLQPVREIGRRVRELKEAGQKIWFHTDAVQAVGKISVNVEDIGCDLLSLSGHKIYAPKGIGALYVRRGVRLARQMLGGHQERERRGGTENVALIAALGSACEIAAKELDSTSAEIGRLLELFEREIAKTVPDIQFNGASAERLPNISNISFRGVEGEGLLINLDMAGFAISTGSACSSGSVEPSPVILSLGCPAETARASVRFSFGKFNTESDIIRLLAVLPEAVEKLRKLSPQYQSASGA